MLKYDQFKILFEEKNESLIFEGFIYSLSYTKFIKKLKNILDKHNSEYIDISRHEDGISLSDLKPNKDYKLYNDIISLLNISGYYVSSYRKDKDKLKYSNIDIKEFIDSDTLYIVFNKNFDFEDSGIKTTLYHLTDNKHLDKIKKIGLVPKSNKTIDNHPDRIYLFDNLDNMETFSKQKQFYNKDFKEVKLKINVTSLPKLKLYIDPKYPNIDAYYTYDNIPPYSIEEFKN